MKKNTRHVTVFLGSLLVAAVLSGVALAGNPHGASPGQAKQQSSSAGASVSASGKETARGQAKHQASAAASAAVPSNTTARGRAKHQSSTTVAVATAGGNATGVKSSSTTGFDMFAQAGSSATKLYGNGKTAGQIAEQHGASASAVLYGPGNSQPHKAALCSNSSKMHLVDVHALRASQSSACVASSVSTTSPSSSETVTGSVSSAMHGNGAAGAKAGAHIKSRAAFTPPRVTGKSRSGVLGAHHSQVSAQAKPAHAVVSAANFTG